MALPAEEGIAGKIFEVRRKNVMPAPAPAPASRAMSIGVFPMRRICERGEHVAIVLLLGWQHECEAGVHLAGIQESGYMFRVLHLLESRQDHAGMTNTEKCLLIKSARLVRADLLFSSESSVLFSAIRALFLSPD
jgi:hypothetical protein